MHKQNVDKTIANGKRVERLQCAGHKRGHFFDGRNDYIVKDGLD